MRKVTIQSHSLAELREGLPVRHETAFVDDDPAGGAELDDTQAVPPVKLPPVTRRQAKKGRGDADNSGP